MHHHSPDALSATQLRISLAVHAGIFVVVNTLLIWIDLTSGSDLWFYWPLLGWGAGLAYHGWAVSHRLRRRSAGHPSERERRQASSDSGGDEAN